MENQPHVGLVEVDRLILLAMERGYRFPTGAKRWAFLAWAAEALDAKRTNAQTYERTELALITERHFPGSTKAPPA